MFGIGMPELIIILVVALVVIGPKKLPDMAKSLGKGLTQFRKATEEIKDGLSENEAYQDLQGLKNSFKDTLDEVNPRKVLDDLNPLVEPKEPKLDLSGRKTVFDAIEAEQAPADEQASIEVAQPDQDQAPAEETASDRPQEPAEEAAKKPADETPKEA